MSLVYSLVKEYFDCRPDPAVLRDHVNDQMAAFEEREGKRRQVLLSKASTPDDYGFVTVVNTRPLHGPAAAKDAPEPESTGLTDFYRFQTRQSRRNQLDELKRKFEEDRARIAVLKRNRIFKEL